MTTATLARVVRRVKGSALAGAAFTLVLCATRGPAFAQTEPPSDKPAAPPAPSAAQPPPPYPYPYAPGYPSAAPGQAPPGYGYPGQPGGSPPPGYAPPGYGYPPGYGQAPPPGYAPPGYWTAPGPAQMDYEEGEPIPPGYTLDTRIRRGPVLAGALMAGITYGINLFIASIDQRRGDEVDWLYVPVVGGWAYTNEVCQRSDGCSFLVLHNLTHTVGAALLIYGLASRRKVLVRDDTALLVAPTLAGSKPGLAVMATF